MSVRLRPVDDKYWSDDVLSTNHDQPDWSRSKPEVDNHGGPPHDGNMDTRVTRLEVIAEDLRNDVHDIRQDMREMRNEFRNEMSEMRKEFREDMSNGFKSLRVNMWLATISAIGISLSAMYGIVQTTLASIDAGRASASVQHTSAPPIIINVPPSPTALPAAPEPERKPKR